MESLNNDNEPIPELISYITLRRLIGILGITFPFILAIGAIFFGNCREIQSSISLYYHTCMQNIFVGTLSAVAVFLFTYKGYPKSHDNIAGNIAGISALGIAFFPTSISEYSVSTCITCYFSTGLNNYIHLISSLIFFSTLAYFSIVLFTKSKTDKPPDKKKLRRNKIYRICGYIMLANLLLIIIYIEGLRNEIFEKYHPVFWLESISLVAFGISWLVKGRIFKKQNEENYGKEKNYISAGN